MAIWGICKRCEKLIPIRPGGYRMESRERLWLAQEHEDANGKRCVGVGKDVG